MGGMEFTIKLEEGDLTPTPAPQAQPSASTVPPQSAAPAPGVPIPNLAPIQQTLLPAIAAVAPILARGLMKRMLGELGQINRNTEKKPPDFDAALKRFYDGLRPGEVPQAWQHNEQQPGIRPLFQPAGGF